eukprot:TRINITY_DN1273_c0_g1_i2.p1 TRINITY_DN1273_c0_g1~~TRINITY_DN1273_c0_g1_i2.p1  ORF type:complete len:213 (-),score=48.72 TRINITY_DN1273_c0_g1_i2:112-750(-)
MERRMNPASLVCARRLSTTAGTQSSEDAEAEKVKQLTIQFNSALNDLLAQGNLNALFLIYEDMLELGVPPDTTTYNILLRSCFASNDLFGVKEYLATMREESVPFDVETCKLCVQASLVTQNPTLVEPMLEDMISGAISTDLREVSDLTESELDQLLAMMVALRSRKLANYVANERRHHVNGSSFSESFLKLEDLAKRIPAEDASIPQAAST